MNTREENNVKEARRTNQRKEMGAMISYSYIEGVLLFRKMKISNFNAVYGTYSGKLEVS